MRLFLVLALLLPPLSAAAPSKGMMYPVPSGAQKAGHVVLQRGVAEQDYFWMEAKYPETPALGHYEQIFATWRQCGKPLKGWDGYGDLARGENRYIHHFVRQWISPANDQAVTLLFRYESAGAKYRTRPDNDEQFVVVIRHRVSDAMEHFATIDVRCPKAPNTTLERDARKSGARPSP